jgi:adenine/guanine phosphoribosyltransferase-like PRPP-binding protein
LGRGYTNLKRIFGWPSDLRLVVDALAETVGDSDAVASGDSGSAPLAALVAYRRSLPAVFVRSVPKKYFLSFGGDVSTNAPELAGERLRPGSSAHLLDDFVHSAVTLTAAAQKLRAAGILVRAASAVLISPPSSIEETIAAADLHLRALVSVDQL